MSSLLLSPRSADCATCPASRWTLYSSILDDDPERLRGIRRGMVQFRPHQTIMRPEDPPNSVYSIYEGWAFCAMALTDGRRQILSFDLPGDMIGLPSLYGELR